MVKSWMSVMCFCELCKWNYSVFDSCHEFCKPLWQTWIPFKTWWAAGWFYHMFSCLFVPMEIFKGQTGVFLLVKLYVWALLLQITSHHLFNSFIVSDNLWWKCPVVCQLSKLTYSLCHFKYLHTRNCCFNLNIYRYLKKNDIRQHAYECLLHLLGSWPSTRIRWRNYQTDPFFEWRCSWGMWLGWRGIVECFVKVAILKLFKYS